MGRLLRDFKARIGIAVSGVTFAFAMKRWWGNRVTIDFADDALPAVAEQKGVHSGAPEVQFRARTNAFAPRKERLEAMRSQHFDMLIVGGGAVGLYTALDASTRGLKVCLVEANDFGAGYSGETTKFVQGGLHDIQRSIRRRDFYFFGRRAFGRQEDYKTLSRVAPRLVEPVDVVMPIHKAVESLELCFAATVASMVRIAVHGFRETSLPSIWSKKDMHTAFPDIVKRDAETEVEGAVVTDGLLVNDNRLPVDLAIAASRAGATVVNHARFKGSEIRRDKRPTTAVLMPHERAKLAWKTWRRMQSEGRTSEEDAKALEEEIAMGGKTGEDAMVDRFTSAMVRDELTGEDIRVEADVLINCAGRWADTVRNTVQVDASDHLFSGHNAHLAFVVPGIAPDLEMAKPSFFLGGPGKNRRVLSVAGNHVNSQSFFSLPHPALPGHRIVGGVDCRYRDCPGENMEHGVDPPPSAVEIDVDFVAKGLAIYGMLAEYPTSVIHPTQSMFVRPSVQPNVIPNAMRYENILDKTLIEARVITPIGATWLDARRVAEQVVNTAWTEVLHRQGVIAEDKAPAPPACRTTKIGLAPPLQASMEATGSETAEERAAAVLPSWADSAFVEPEARGAIAETFRLRRVRLGDDGAAAVECMEADRAELREPLIAGLPQVTRAEALYALQHEGAECVLDVMRRSAALDADALSCFRGAKGAVNWLGAELKWSKTRRGMEADMAERFAKAFVPPIITAAPE